MTSSVGKLIHLAIRLKDVQNLLNEDISVSPHHYPGILTETMGGPAMKRKKHQTHTLEGPRGIAGVEEDEDDES